MKTLIFSWDSCSWEEFCALCVLICSQIANTLRSMSVRQWSDVKVSDQSLIDVDLKGFVIWGYVLYCQTCDIRHTLVCNKIVDHSDVVGAAADRHCSNYICILNLTPGFNILHKDETRNINVLGFCAPYIRDSTVSLYLLTVIADTSSHNQTN